MYLRIGSRVRTAVYSIGALSCAFLSRAPAQISIDVGEPSVGINLHIQQYPRLVPVPRYPVYYAPGVDSNLFFYDGQYWVYAQDNWYTSSWYNGPWDFVPPETVPDFILRIPLLYYQRPPAYFSSWGRGSPPHWGEHWGREWENRRRGWNHWNRKDVPRRAPPPAYQRNYSHEHYPRLDEQRALRERNYRNEPRENMARHQFDRPQTGAMEPNRTTELNRVPAVRQRPDASPRDSADSRNSSGDRQPRSRQNDNERRGAPPQPVRDAAGATRPLPGPAVPLHANPQILQRQGKPEHAEPPPNLKPSKPPTREQTG
jgi:hypothetical protein